jgi:hypothetical protein
MEAHNASGSVFLERGRRMAMGGVFPEMREAQKPNFLFDQT